MRRNVFGIDLFAVKLNNAAVFKRKRIKNEHAAVRCDLG